MRVAVSIDHAGVTLRDIVMQTVRDAGHELLDLGRHDDYPDSALDVGRAIAAELTAAFCAARFSGEERHVRRLGKVLTMERDAMEASW